MRTGPIWRIHSLPRCLAAYQEHRFQYEEHPAGCATLSTYLDEIEQGRYREQGGHIFIHGAPQHEFLFGEDGFLVKKLLRLDDPMFFPKLCLAVGPACRPCNTATPHGQGQATSRRGM